MVYLIKDYSLLIICVIFNLVLIGLKFNVIIFIKFYLGIFVSY